MEPEIGKVMIDCEAIVADSAVKGGGMPDAVTEISASCQGSLEEVLRCKPRLGVTRRLEYLSDLEGIISGIAVNRNGTTGIIQYEGVVAFAAVNAQFSVDMGVIVDSLDTAVFDRLSLIIEFER